MINQYFEHVFCINLKRRTDRRAEAEAEFNKFGIKVEFIDGVDGMFLDDFEVNSLHEGKVRKGDLGCTLSHLNVVKTAKERGYKNYFVFEDDAVFSDDFNTAFPIMYNQLPEDWQMVYLGGNHDGGFTHVNTHVAKIQRTFTTHAFGAKSEIYDELINVLEKVEKVDVTISSLHSKLNCYVFRPHIAFQRAGFSDILNRFEDYQHLRK